MRHYLSPEPMLQSPRWAQGEARRGFSTPTYAYARNNPVRYTDPTGLCVSTYDCCIQRNPGNPAACGGFTGPKPFELPKFDPNSLLNPVKKFVGDVCKVLSMSATVTTLQECYDACAGGTSAREAFCRRLTDPAQQALCWAATNESETYCRNTCLAIFNP